MKVALYARVSKDEKYDDNRYQELENQLEPLQKYCGARGWEVVRVFTDKKSGADSGREGFREMLRKSWEYDAVVVWKLDRFSREPLINTLSYIRQMRDNKCGLVSMTETWLDTRQDNPVAELILAIMSWFSQEERRKISGRTKAGINRRKNIGQYRGGRPPKCKECGRQKWGKKRPLCNCDEKGGSGSGTSEA